MKKIKLNEFINIFCLCGTIAMQRMVFIFYNLALLFKHNEF